MQEDLPGVVKRMQTELHELGDRLSRAHAFLNTATFNFIPPAEQALFHDQVMHMEGYEAALSKRLALVIERL